MVAPHNPSWLPQAKKQLKEIYIFYKNVAGIRVAEQRTTRIQEAVECLVSHPFLGKELTTQSNLPRIFRVLIVSDYKIVYYIKNNIIKIAAIFDCRQNPDSLYTQL